MNGADDDREAFLTLAEQLEGLAKTLRLEMAKAEGALSARCCVAYVQQELGEVRKVARRLYKRMAGREKEEA